MERVDRWLSVIGNAGVILGLILVAVELRQTTNAMQGATYFARAESSMQWNMWIAESDHMLPAIVRYQESGEFRSLTPEDRARHVSAALAAFDQLDGLFYQYELGLLSADYYDGMFKAGMEAWVPRWVQWGMFRHPYIVRGMRPTFGKEIEKFTDAEIWNLTVD